MLKFISINKTGSIKLYTAYFFINYKDI